MKIFLSWSGSRSHRVAVALQGWLRSVIQSAAPWVSSEDIEKGKLWGGKISAELESTNFGIICLTSENTKAPWILFEAGALSKQVGMAHVCPLLLDLRKSDVDGPLAQFQLTSAEKSDVLKLIKAINGAQDGRLTDSVLDTAVEMWWPTLEKTLNEIRLEPSGESPATPKRAVEEILEEVLGHVRNLVTSRDARELIPEKPKGMEVPDHTEKGAATGTSPSTLEFEKE